MSAILVASTSPARSYATTPSKSAPATRRPRRERQRAKALRYPAVTAPRCDLRPERAEIQLTAVVRGCLQPAHSDAARIRRARYDSKEPRGGVLFAACQSTNCDAPAYRRPETFILLFINNNSPPAPESIRQGRAQNSAADINRRMSHHQWRTVPRIFALILPTFRQRNCARSRSPHFPCPVYNSLERCDGIVGKLVRFRALTCVIQCRQPPQRILLGQTP